jgi:hypothetical protein
MPPHASNLALLQAADRLCGCAWLAAGYARQVHLCTSMGPSIPVVVSSLLPAIDAAANL